MLLPVEFVGQFVVAGAAERFVVQLGSVVVSLEYVDPDSKLFVGREE